MGLDYQENYLRNLDFWETAWKRVSKAINKPPDFAYVKNIPSLLNKYNIKSVVDLACGSGWLSFMLAEQGFQVTGVDISESAIKLATQVKKDIYKNQIDAEFLSQDILSMKLDFKVDCDVINACFEHFNRERAVELLKNSLENLKDEAYIYAVFDQVALSDKGEFLELADGTREYKDTYRAGMFLRNYSDEELKEIFQELNLKILSWEIVDNESRSVLVQVSR